MDKMVKAATSKASGKAKTFNDNAHYQGSLKVPLPAKKEYGTGLPYKKPAPKLSTKKK
jgi:hypothetical protein